MAIRSKSGPSPAAAPRNDQQKAGEELLDLTCAVTMEVAHTASRAAEHATTLESIGARAFEAAGVLSRDASDHQLLRKSHEVRALVAHALNVLATSSSRRVECMLWPLFGEPPETARMTEPRRMGLQSRPSAARRLLTQFVYCVAERPAGDSKKARTEASRQHPQQERNLRFRDSSHLRPSERFLPPAQPHFPPAVSRSANAKVTASAEPANVYRWNKRNVSTSSTSPRS